MAIFKKNEKAEESKGDVSPAKSGKEKELSTDAGDSQKNAKTKKASVLSVGKSVDVEYILTKPHITEKASMHAENNVYVFEVSRRANKTLVRNAVKELYKVTPEKINIVNTPAKAVSSRGIKGVKSGKKKALVFLKKGDAIEII